MLIQPELQATLKRLRLSGMLATLPDRLAFARQDKLDYTDFLQLVLSDEIERRDHKHIQIRLHDVNRIRSAGVSFRRNSRSAFSTSTGVRQISAVPHFNNFTWLEQHAL